MQLDFLVKRAANGDKDAFIELMEQEKVRMYKVAYCYLHNDADIADAMQETVLAVYEKIGTLKNYRYFRTWMTRILINKCMDILREYQHQNMLIRSAEPEIRVDEHLAEFKDVLDQIDEKYRIILVLRYVYGMKTKEIARVLQLNENTVNTRIFRGTKLLREAYSLS